MIQTILTFIVIFTILVVVHEFGHYFFAKRAGILVRDFSIGFGPKLFSIRKNGTAYTLRLLPIGGFVRMAGNDEEETEIKPGTPLGLVLNEAGEVVRINLNAKKQLTNAVPLEVIHADLEKDLFIEGHINGDEEEVVRYPVNEEATVIERDGVEVQIAPIKVQFQSASLPNRMMTNFAGPMNNFILAIVAYILFAFVAGGAPVNDSVIGNVVPEGVAAEAGLKADDKIIEINNKAVASWDELSQIIQANPDKNLTLEFERDGQKETIDLTPKKIEVDKDQYVGQIGIQSKVDTSFFGKIKYGFTNTWAMMGRLVDALKDLVTGGFSLNKLSGPVGIYTSTEKVAQSGITSVISWLAFLSINLGIMNLLPIPALDGGKLLLNLVEAIRRKPMSPEKEGLITLVGVGIMLVLMVLVTWNDIMRGFF